ncbi:MAG TPA: ABC transporter permease, partial [bacterium]|nr:ABC transporter permease [bacterium]
MNSMVLAWISLKRRPWSTFLAVVSLAIALAILARTAQFFHYLRQGLTAYDHTVQVVVAPKSSSLEILLQALYGIGESTSVLPFALVTEAIQKQGTTEQVTPMALFGYWQDYPIFATDDTFMQRPQGLSAPQIALGEWFRESGQVVLGSEVARRSEAQIGDTISCAAPFFHRGSTQPIWSREMIVVGILEPTESGHDGRILGTLHDAFDMQRIAIPLKMLREASNQQAVSWFMVWTKPHQEQALKRFIDEKTVGYTMITKDAVRQLQGLFDAAVKVGQLVLTAVLTLGGLCLAILLNTRFESMIEE